MLFAAAGASALDVAAFMVTKSQAFGQNDASAPTFIGPFKFAAQVFATYSPDFSAPVVSASVRAPNGQTVNLSPDILSLSFGYDAEFDTKSALDAQFSNGTYSFAITTRNDGFRTPSLSLSGDAYPTTPHVRNWSAAQVIEAGQDFALTWDALANVAGNDQINLMITDEFGSYVTGLYVYPYFEGTTVGISNLVVIPANTLAAGSTYLGTLQFHKGFANLSAYPGAYGVASFAKSTQFSLKTTTPQGAFQFSSPAYSFSETGGVATLTVRRISGSVGMVSVQYSTSDGSASADLDYTPAEGTLTFDEGVTNQTFQIAILDESLIEGPELFYVALSNPQGGASLGPQSLATVTIRDNDVPPGPNVRTYFVGKGQTFNQLSAGPSVLATNDPAQPPFEFYAFVEPVFGGGVSSATLRLPNGTTNLFSDDGSQFTLDQTFSLKASLDAQFAAGTYGFQMQTLTDGVRAPSLSLPPDNYPSTPHLTNWASLQAVDASGDFTLVWDPFAGGTTNDFVHLTIKDSAGNTTYDSPGFLEAYSLNGLVKSFTIPANTFAPLSSYTNRLLFVKRTALNTNGYPGVAGLSGYYKQTFFPLFTAEPAPAAGRFRFSAPAYSVSETGVLASITVLRSGSSAGDATVDYATAPGGSATPNADFIPAADTLSFADGETNKSFSISILDDFLLETNETVRLVLSNPTGGADLGQPTNAVLTIIDNELVSSGVIQFSATNYTVLESGPVASILISRTGGGASGVTVDFTTSDGTATEGLDYTNASRTLSFAANELSKTVTIPIINDTLDETNETVLLSLSNPTGGASLGPRANAVLVIQDNDIGGLISFSAAAYSVSETSAVARVVVNRTGGAASAVTVDLATRDGSATEGADYVGFTNTLAFAANETSKTNLISLIPDTLPEGDETVNLSLRNATGGAALGAISNAVLTIVDDEVTVQFSKDVYTNSEAGLATITIVRSGPLTSTVGVTLSTANDTATAGQDYTGVSTNLVLTAGVASKAFAISLKDDTIVEGNETVLLNLSNPTGGAQLGNRTNAVLVLVDNDAGGVIQFSATNYTVLESGPMASIVISRTGGSASGVTVDFTTSDGTATEGLDYTNASRTLSFAANELSKTVTIPIINDTLDEPNETVLLSLSNPTGGASLGPRANAVLVIQDNDIGGIISFSAAAYSVSETSAVARVVVNRTGGVASAVTVDLATRDGSATEGADYVGFTNTLAFAANETSKTNFISILPDTLPEGDETVNLSLRNPTGGAALGAISNAVLTIVDDEVTVQFSKDVYTNSEAGVATITIVRSGPLTSTVGVTLSTGDGTATAGQDYTGVSTNLVLTAGVASKAFAISLKDDTIVEGNETVLLNLSNPTGGAQLGNRTNAVLLLFDNDAGGVIQFSATNYTVLESGPVASIIISRTGGAASGVTVDFTTADGTATVGLDYTDASRTLSFAANELSKTVTIPIINDTLDETNETVLLSLSNPTGGASLGPKANAVLLIQDNDTAGVIGFSATNYTVYETGIVARIIVTRTGGAASGVTVDFATIAGSATDGIDYTGFSGTLEFAANEMSKTNFIPVMDNNDIDGNRTVLLGLSNPSGGASLGANSHAVLTIKDDEFDARGTYNISGSIAVTACTYPEDNGSLTFSGQMIIDQQTGRDFSGRAIVFYPDGENYTTQEISGQVDSAGRISTTYIWTGLYSSGTGTNTGTISGNTIQIRFNGDDDYDTCLHSGSISGSRYLPPAGGYAPDYPQGARVTCAIVSGSGELDYNGTFAIQLFPADNTYELTHIAMAYDWDSSGNYIYVKTGLNTATLQLIDQYFGSDVVLKLTFTSGQPAGLYTATEVGFPGSQSGSFSGSP